MIKGIEKWNRYFETNLMLFYLYERRYYKDTKSFPAYGDNDDVWWQRTYMTLVLKCPAMSQLYVFVSSDSFHIALIDFQRP